MSDDRDEAALLRDLDEGVWITMAALADIAEERGDLPLAMGYRWLAENHKEPRLSDNIPSEERFKWYGGRPLALATQSDDLPKGSVTSEVGYDGWTRHAKRSEAYAVAARGVGDWLASQAEPSTPDAPKAKRYRYRTWMQDGDEIVSDWYDTRQQAVATVRKYMNTVYGGGSRYVIDEEEVD